MTIDDIQIRTFLKAGDFGNIMYLHGKVYIEEYDHNFALESHIAKTLTEFYDTLESANNQIWLAEHDSKLIGVIALMDRSPIAQLRFFVLDKHYRGLGLGKKLMNLCMTTYHRGNYLSCYLWTISELEAAIGLYKKYGFQLTEERPANRFGKATIEQKFELN